MTKNTNIEWADHTFNPWEGCQKIGPGCDHCYAEARNARFGGGVAVNWGPGAPRRRTSAANWRQPLKWEREAYLFRQCNDCGWRGTMKGMLCMQCHGADTKEARQRVFCSSLADVFDNEVDPQWRADLFKLIEQTPNLDWLLLTKRIGNVGNMLPVPFDFDRLYPNVWLGATIVNQEEADRDIPKLWQVPAAKRFLSIEPMLGPINLTTAPTPCPNTPEDCCGGPSTIDYLNGSETCPACEGGEPICGSIDWVICGGESGPNARPMHPDWARGLRDQCQAAGVPFLFKQWGEWWEVDSEARDHEGKHIVLDAQDCEKFEGYTPKTDCVITLDGQVFPHPDQLPDDVPGRWMTRLGKKAAGRTLDGRTWNRFPS